MNEDMQAKMTALQERLAAKRAGAASDYQAAIPEQPRPLMEVGRGPAIKPMPIAALPDGMPLYETVKDPSPTKMTPKRKPFPPQGKLSIRCLSRIANSGDRMEHRLFVMTAHPDRGAHDGDDAAVLMRIINTPSMIELGDCLAACYSSIVGRRDFNVEITCRNTVLVVGRYLGDMATELIRTDGVFKGTADLVVNNTTLDMVVGNLEQNYPHYGILQRVQSHLKGIANRETERDELVCPPAMLEELQQLRRLHASLADRVNFWNCQTAENAESRDGMLKCLQQLVADPEHFEHEGRDNMAIELGTIMDSLRNKSVKLAEDLGRENKRLRKQNAELYASKQELLRGMEAAEIAVAHAHHAPG